jgi:hypothetical protein
MHRQSEEEPAAPTASQATALATALAIDPSHVNIDTPIGLQALDLHRTRGAGGAVGHWLALAHTLNLHIV